MAKSMVTVHYNHFPKIAKALPKETARIVRRTAQVLVDDIKANMAANQSPSVPGDYPAVVTGNLINSLTTEPLNQEGTQYLAGTNVEYAVHLEYGTVRMAARPFFTPSAERIQPAFVEAMKHLEEGLKNHV